MKSDAIINQNYFAGVDIGSTTTKCVVFDSSGIIAGKTIIPTGTNINKACADVVSICLESMSVSQDQLQSIVTTGYGRYIPTYAKNILPEIQAIARGVKWNGAGGNGGNSKAKLILDIGGHDTKALVVDERGNLIKFATNEKCAAGTGKFVENIAEMYGYRLEELASLAFQSTKECKLESHCGIFIESEISRMLSSGCKTENVFAALFLNMIKRVMSIVFKLDYPSNTLYFTGGVSRNPYAVKLLHNYFEEVIVPEDSQLTCAIGAADHAQFLTN